MVRRCRRDDSAEGVHDKKSMKYLIRRDALLFYSLASISFLESTVATYVENLSRIFMTDPEMIEWLQTVWLREESEHGRLAKQVVQENWPEFDWEKGYRLFLSNYRPRTRFFASECLLDCS